MDIRVKDANSFEVISGIIAEVSNSLYSGNVIRHNDAKPLYSGNRGYRGRIRTIDSKATGSRCSWSGRRGPVACWHAYRDVIRAILTRYPDATIKTAQARYEGLAGFEDTYPQTANINIGSMMQHAYMPELCDCGGYE